MLYSHCFVYIMCDVRDWDDGFTLKKDQIYKPGMVITVKFKTCSTQEFYGRRGHVGMVP